MTIDEVRQSTQLPAIELELLIAHVLGRPRTWVVGHPEYVLRTPEEQGTTLVLERRHAGEPVAYITGEKEFYGRSFAVDHRVLIPRPATEHLITLTLDFLRTGNEESRSADTGICVFAKKLKPLSDVRTIVDIGTGSGCIAVTLACELPPIIIIAVDVSADALEVAQGNAKRHCVDNRISFRQGSLLEPVRDEKEPFLLVSNPPYISQNEDLPRDVRSFEPKGALFAGMEGMDVLHPLILQNSTPGMLRLRCGV